jgi:hypothetical protein
MQRRSRLGPPSGPKALAVVAAAVLIVALVVTGRSLSGRGTRPSTQPPQTTTTDAPYRIGGRVACPLGRPVLASSDGKSYPPGHPSRPPRDAAPVACYQTTAQATGAGYPPAPLPASALEISGVYLTPTSRAFRASCQQNADRLGFAVPCPGLLPTSPSGPAPPRLCEESSTCLRGQLLWLTQDGFVVPPGSLGAQAATAPW